MPSFDIVNKLDTQFVDNAINTARRELLNRYDLKGTSSAIEWDRKEDSITITGDNTGATDSEGIGTASVWEAFTISECADVTINYCGTDPVYGNVFTSIVDDCAFTTVFDALTIDGCGDDNYVMAFTGLAAGTYYVPVLSEPL